MHHAIVSQNEWLAALRALLAKEKEFTKTRDHLSEARRALPWVKVEKNYVFEGPNGRETLADLFGGKSQLIVYHFMLGPGWVQGCPSCSFLADHFDGAVIHLFNHDFHVSFTPEEKAHGKVEYNYELTEFPSEEAPGLSAFIKNEAGDVVHTYSSYARGLDILVGTYNFLDMAPKGRDEGALPWSMAWVRRHDEYEPAPAQTAASKKK